MKEGSLSTSRNRGYQCQRQRASWMRRGPSTYWPRLGRGSWTGTPWGVWVGVCFISRLYYPFGKGPGQHIIRCLKKKQCENERKKCQEKPTSTNLKKRFEKIELAAKLLEYFLRSNKSNINQPSPALKQGCGKQTPSAGKLFNRANWLYVPNIKM